MPTTADKLDTAERFAYLNIVSDISREGPASLAGLEGVAEQEVMNGSKELSNTIKWLVHYAPVRRSIGTSCLAWATPGTTG